MGQKTIKINDSNQATIRGIVSEMALEATQQLRAISIHVLEGKILEMKETVKTLTALKEKETEHTYAQIAKKSERARSLSRKRQETHVAIIYPKNANETDDNRDNIKKELNPANINVGIKRIKKVSKGGLLLEVCSKDEYNVLENETTTNQGLADKYTIKKAKKMRPKVIIYNVSERYENDEILKAVECQNEHLKGSKLNIEYRMETQSTLLKHRCNSYPRHFPGPSIYSLSFQFYIDNSYKMGIN